MQILLDGGRDDNFLQPRIAKFLHLEVQPTNPIKAMVSNGTTLQVEGCIDKLEVDI